MWWYTSKVSRTLLKKAPNRCCPSLIINSLSAYCGRCVVGMVHGLFGMLQQQWAFAVWEMVYCLLLGLLSVSGPIVITTDTCSKGTEIMNLTDHLQHLKTMQQSINPSTPFLLCLIGRKLNYPSSFVCFLLAK